MPAALVASSFTLHSKTDYSVTMLSRRGFQDKPQWPTRTTSLLRRRVVQVQLPDELLIHILCFLNLRDLLRCRLANRRVYTVINNSLTLQFRIELSHAALLQFSQPVTGKTSHSTTLQRLDLLRKLQFSWRNLAWRSRKTIPLGQPYPLYELSSGIFITAARRAGVAKPHKLIFQELPSLDNHSNISRATIDCGIPTSQVCIDVSQDLLVLLEEGHQNTGLLRQGHKLSFRVHLRSLANNTLHPAARRQVLEYEWTSSWTSYTFVMQIMGHSLGILFSSGVLGDSDFERFVVWDWRTGAMRGMVFMPGSRYDSFTFISPDTFVIPCARTETINVFLFRPTPPPGIPDRGPSIHHLCALKLPALNPTTGYKYINVTCQSQPTPDPPAHAYYAAPHTIPRPKSKLFAQDQANGIVQFTASVSRHARTVDLLIITHRKALMSFVTSSQDALGDPLTEPWESYPMMPAKTWGPDIGFKEWRAVSRCMLSQFTYLANSNWRSQVFGYRVAQLVRNPAETTNATVAPVSLARAGHIRVLDFNPLFVKRPPLFPEDYHHIIQSTVTRRMVTDVGIIPKGEIWVENIESSLPYYEVTTREAFPLAGIMMDEERLIGLRTASPGSPDLVALDVFVI
ncbi:hypothetical protein PIIN_06813 [Serendipita indica DSM 11827]|uniref:F-box domain-containing protein n=1 Tax=Serendipita indica (strain DSM 11827) TaxID=1109443 RepID=G4TNI6_SERID|nr:hypothetical protein PIIN_06813 [Serendipita indica DSM 11827]